MSRMHYVRHIFITILAHGVSQGVINELRGESFKIGVVGKVGGHYAVKYLYLFSYIKSNL